MTPALKRSVLILNTLGFLAYLVWLAQFDTGETLRSSNGILFYIPCVPFLFLYMLMLPPPKPGPKEKPWWQSDEDYERDLREKHKDSPPPPPPPTNSPK